MQRYEANSFVLINMQLGICLFSFAVKGAVSNQGKLVTLAVSIAAKYKSIGACGIGVSASNSVSVNIASSTSNMYQLISSHSANVNINEPRYFGFIVFLPHTLK